MIETKENEEVSLYQVDGDEITNLMTYLRRNTHGPHDAVALCLTALYWINREELKLPNAEFASRIKDSVLGIRVGGDKFDA